MDLVFGPSTAWHTVDIQITDDSLLETNETFVLELYLISLAPNMTIYPNFTTVTIVDNEGQFADDGNIIEFYFLTFKTFLRHLSIPVQYAVSEQSGSVEVNVSVLDGETPSGISVEVSLAERSGTAFGETQYCKGYSG